jgi:hypothetical protein
MTKNGLTTGEFMELLKPPYLTPVPIPKPAQVADGTEDYFDGIDTILATYPPRPAGVARGHVVDAKPDGEHKNESGNNE